MSKVMVLRGLPPAGAYRQPPGRIVALRGHSVSGDYVRARYLDMHGLPVTYARRPGMGGLGSPATDRQAAIAMAAGTRDIAKGLCNLINHPQDVPRQTRERAACVAAADAAYVTAVGAITAAIQDDPETSTDPTTTTSDYLARLAEIERRQLEQQQAWAANSQPYQQEPGDKGDKILGMEKSTAIAVGIGAAVLGIFLLK